LFKAWRQILAAGQIFPDVNFILNRKTRMKRLTALLRVLVPTLVMATSAMAADYDVVINNGRDFDPNQ